jgi:hypothetical protein
MAEPENSENSKMWQPRISIYLVVVVVAAARTGYYLAVVFVRETSF